MSRPGSPGNGGLGTAATVAKAAVKLANPKRAAGGDHVNIKVAVRARPLGEGADRGSTLQFQDGKQLSLAHPQQGGQRSEFTFDHVYGPETTQAQIYNDCGCPILDCAFEGYNGTIFAYGQTGSGKSHTIMGSATDLGIIPRLGVDLFSRVERVAGCTCVVTATYLELYNEVVCDLLSPGNQGLKIRQHIKTGIYVEDLTEVQLSNRTELERLITEGNKARQVAATRMNERSSRSHAIFTLLLRQEHVDEEGRGRVLSSKINLVDLAGSERADLTADSGRLQEGAAINKSLSALGNVINALTEGAGGRGAAHVPYRSSKLTRLLEESLGGNTVTVMLAAISADPRHARETLSTLKRVAKAPSN